VTGARSSPAWTPAPGCWSWPGGRSAPAADLADLCRPLPFGDGAFDDVVAALVLHYLEDWTAPLAELRRVLKAGGRLIVAVDHPFVVNLMHREAGRKPDYFATYNHTAEWTMGGQTARMSFWHRPLHAMTDACTAAGFRMAVISEPPPAPGARELLPESLGIYERDGDTHAKPRPEISASPNGVSRPEAVSL
jgi:SAM-dependent methyltransferase